VDGLLGQNVQQDECERHRGLRDHHGGAEPDRGRREGKQQRRDRQVCGGDNELAARRGAVASQPVEPAGEQPAEAGGGDDRCGCAGHLVADREGGYRDPHGSEVQPDGQVQQGQEEESRPQQGGPFAMSAFDALAGRLGRGAALGGQRRTPAEDQGRGDGAGQGRVADRAERGDQNGPEEEGGGIGQRFQGEGAGKFIGPLAAQQVSPAGRGQGAELGDGRAGTGGGDDRRGRGGGRKDADAADSGSEEEDGSAGGAQQGTVAGGGAGHEGVLRRRPAGRTTRGRRRLSTAERCDPWPAREHPGLRWDGTRALAAAPDTGRNRNVRPGPRRTRATGRTITGWGGVAATWREILPVGWASVVK
jgi:hypothetical protein